MKQLSVCAFTLALILAKTTDARAQSTESSALKTAAREENSLRAVLVDSFKLLLVEHGIRIGFQAKTRRELDGPFWKDYRRSVRMPEYWEDTDAWLVNYIGHPIHGAAAGFVWLDHRAPQDQVFSFDRGYIASRARAAAFSAAYSFQFEIGPLSEASIGNVGLRPETMGWVDFVVTPGAGFGLIVAEDVLDRYFLEWVERHTQNRFARASLRVVFNPSRTLANLAQNRPPWHRAERTLGWR